MNRMMTVLVLLALSLSAAVSEAAPQLINYKHNEVPGSIIISYSKRRLYFIKNESQAYVYPVAVPKSDQRWFGRSRVEAKVRQPSWTAPPEVYAAKPALQGKIFPGGHPDNPMGEAAILLENNSVTQAIAIHGIAQGMDSTIGTPASFGCVRMYNSDVLHLFLNVESGALVEMRR